MGFNLGFKGLISVVNSDPEVRCSGRVHSICFTFFLPSKKLRFNHLALSKVITTTTVTVTTTTINEIVPMCAQSLSAKGRKI